MSNYRDSKIFTIAQDYKWARWKCVLFTRIANPPTLLIAIFADIHHLTNMNDILNVLQSLQLPFALFPILHFTNEDKVLSTFKNGYFTKTIIWCLAIAVISINGYLIAIDTSSPDEWYEILKWIGVGLFAIPYIVLVLYLAFKAFVSSLPQTVADDIGGHLPDVLEICRCSYVASKLSILSDKIGRTLKLKFSISQHLKKVY